MDFEVTDEERAWREDLRAFLAEYLTDPMRRELEQDGEYSQGPASRVFAEELERRGWRAIAGSEDENDGTKLTPLQAAILSEEFSYAGAPRLGYAVTALGPMIARYGTEQNKRDWLPGIYSGDIRLALGYSEPEAGTDLANLQTRAERDGDEWVINGEKAWNTGAHTSTHEWLAVRTDPDAPRHKGISIMIVPLDAEGVEIKPLWTWGDIRTNQAFFTDVRVPARNVIGEVNAGWSYIVGALDNERGVIGGTSGSLRRLLDELVDECKRTTRDGELLSSDPDIRRQLAELEMEVEIIQLLGWEVAASIQSGTVATLPATVQKIMTTELRTRLSGIGMSLFGLRGQLGRGDWLAPLGGELEQSYRLAPYRRFGGGTNEVLRDVIAQRGYGLPRAGRR